MEISLGLKITHTRDDATSSTEFRFDKDTSGPLFFSRETATMFILIAYLRGFKRENIKIKISEDGKQLTIGGKKPVQEITLRGWIMHKKDEIREFKKVFLIPDGVNLNRTKAKFNNEESTLRITMPKLVKGICGIEIQELTEEHKERHETEVPVDDQAHGKECEAEISEVPANQSLLKEGKSFEEGLESRIERKEKSNDVVEKAVDTVPLEKDSQVETDGTPMEKVAATIMSEKEKTDHAADQLLDGFQGVERNQLEQGELQGDKQDQVKQAFDELQSDKHDQVNRRDVSRREPKAPSVVTDETSHKGGKSVQEDAESATENIIDQMVEPQHEEADQQSDVSRRELEIPQAMIDETTQKDAKLLEKDSESKMPSKLDQSVDKPQLDTADKVQLSEASRYEPKMSQVKIDENIERDIGDAQPDKLKKKHLGKLEIPEAMIDETPKYDGKPLERGLGSMMEREEDQIKKPQMEVSSSEPNVPQVMVGVATQKIENSEKDGAELMTESKEEKGNQSAEQVVDEQQYEKSSQKDSSSMGEVEATGMRMPEKIDHVVDQALAEIQGNEFPDEKRDQEGPSFGKFQIDEQHQMNQRDVSCEAPEASLVVTDETLQKVKKSLEEDAAESMMERKKGQLAESQHDEADREQQMGVSRCELEIPQAMIDETAQKDVKSREEDADSMMPSKVGQMVDKPQHDEAEQLKPRNVSRDKAEIPHATTDESIGNKIGEALGYEVDSVPHREIHRCELEMPEAMIDETVQEDSKPLEEGAESMMKIKEKIDQVNLVDHAEQSEAIYSEQSRVSTNEPEVSEDLVDEIIRKEPDVPEAMVDATSRNEEKPDGDTELMEERKEKKMDEVAEQVVDAQQHDKADNVEKCEGGKFLEEVAQPPMMKSKKKIDWVDEHADGGQQSDKVDHAEHPEVIKYEPEVPNAMVDAASQKEEKSLEESGEMMTGSKEKKPDEVAEQVVDEHQYDKADHVGKREITCLEYEMPAVLADETSPEDGKFLQEAAETMTKNKMKNFQEVDKVSDEPQCNQMDHARQRTVSRCEPEIPPAVIDDTSVKDGTLQETVTEFVEQVIDEPVSATETNQATNQAEKREVSRFKNEMPDVVVDETSLTDDNSQEKAEAMMKSKEKIDQVAEKAVEQDKSGGVDKVQRETESKKLIPEEKSKEPENKGSKRSAEEKLSETEPKEMQAIAEVMPQTIASMQSEEATPENKELPFSFLETISRESLETHQAGREQVTNVAPDVAIGTVDTAPENAKEDKVQLGEVSTYEPKISQVKIDEIERDIGEAESDKVMKKQLGKLEMPEAAIDETQKNDGKSLEQGSGMKRKEDQIEKHLAENVDEREFKTEQDETLLLEAEPDAMQSEEASAEGEEHPTSLASYAGSRAQESDDSKGVHFGEKKVHVQDSELGRFPAGDALTKDEEMAKENLVLEMESKQEIDRAKENEVFQETDARKSVQEKMDEEPKMEMKEETEKLADENADKGKMKKKIEAADTIPQIIATVKDEEATHKKEERHTIPAFCPTPGTSKSTASEIHQAKGKRVGDWEPKKTTVEAEEVSEKDDKSVKSGRKDQEEIVYIMEHMSRDLQFKKVEAVTGGSHELDDEELVSEEKSEKSDIDTGKKETKGAVEEKVDEKVSNDVGDVPEVAPEVVASFKLEEATHRKEEPHVRLDSYPETTEDLKDTESPFVSEEVSEWERRTIETVAEGTPKIYEQSSEEETKPGHAVDEKKFKDLAEAVELSPKMDSLKPMVEEKNRDSETEITEATAEKTIEKKAGEREIKEFHGLTGEVPEAFELTKLDGATPKDDKLPASTSYSDTKILDPEVSEHDRIEKQELIVDAASDEVKGSLEETEKNKTDSKEERDHVTGHAADEWQFKKVDVTEVSPPLDSNQMMSEEKFEKPDTGIKEVTEKVMDEKVDEGESRKLQDVTQLVDEIPATTFRVEEPLFWGVTEASGAKSEKEIEQQQMTEPTTQQSQREEFLHLKEHEKQVLSSSRSLMEEKAQRPKSIDLADVKDQVTQPEEPYGAESRPMKGKTLSEPEKQEHETTVEGTMKSQPDKMIQQVEAPFLTVETQQNVSRAHDKDHGLKHDTEGPVKPEPGQEKQQVKTPTLADKLPRDGDQGQQSETTQEKQELSMSFKGYMKLVPDKEREQVIMPHVADEQQGDGDYIPKEGHGLEKEVESEKRENEMSFVGPTELKSDQEKERFEAPILADELPQDGDHGKRNETAPEGQELGMYFQGHMKPASDQERVQDETPILADDIDSGRDHSKYENFRQGYESELDKKESELSSEGPMNYEPDQEKEQVETPIPEDQPQQHRDHAKDEKQGRRNEKTPETQEVGMSFEKRIESAAPDRKKQLFDTPLHDDKLQHHGEAQEQGSEAKTELFLPEVFSEGPIEPELDQKIEQVETTLLAHQPVQSGDDRQDEVHGLHGEIESEKMETQVIPEGPKRPETDKEEQVETPVLADKRRKDKGRGKAKVHELGKEIEELHDELQLPEKKETEELRYPETEMQKDFSLEQTSRKMDTVDPIKCKLRSFLLFAGSTFLLPLIMIVIKKSLIEFKSKKR